MGFTEPYPITARIYRLIFCLIAGAPWLMRQSVTGGVERLKAIRMLKGIKGPGEGPKRTPMKNFNQNFNPLMGIVIVMVMEITITVFHPTLQSKVRTQTLKEAKQRMEKCGKIRK